MIIVLKLSILSAIITLFWTIKTITTKKMKATIEKEYPLTEWDSTDKNMSTLLSFIFTVVAISAILMLIEFIRWAIQ